MTDHPTPDTDELRAALSAVLLAAEYAAADRYWEMGYRPDGAPDAAGLRRAGATVRLYAEAMADGPSLAREVAALRVLAGRADSMLSYIRHRVVPPAAWPDSSILAVFEVDQLIGRLRRVSEGHSAADTLAATGEGGE